MSAASQQPSQPVSADAALGSTYGHHSAVSESVTGVVPFLLKEPVDLESLRRFRASLVERLEEGRVRARIAEEARDSVAAVLPGALGVAMRRFDPPELFLRAEIGYVEPGTSYRIDVAWPAKRIGIRVLGPHLGDDNQLVPATLAVDAALRDRGWLILPVDPDAVNSVEQLERALRVVSRVGVYRR